MTKNWGKKEFWCFALMLGLWSLSGFGYASYLQKGDVGFAHTLVLKDDGTIRAWGKNDQGQVGDGSTQRTEFPAKLNLSNVVSVTAGSVHSIALLNDGSVWAWGDNSRGQLAQPESVTNSLVPVQVPGLENVISVLSGDGHTLALDSLGVVWAWGGNGFGQVGNGTTSTSFSPFSVPLRGPAVAIAVGSNFSYALLQDGSAWMWGMNEHFNGYTNGLSIKVPKQLSSWSVKKATKVGSSQPEDNPDSPSVVMSSLERVMVINTDGSIEHGDVTTLSDPNNSIKTVNWSGALQVIITPEEAGEVGVQWSIDGGEWHNSGETVTGLFEGEYTVDFRDTYKWAAPSTQRITVREGQLTSHAVESRRKQGSLVINLVPEEAVSAGVQWRIRGGEWQDSGAMLLDLPVDNYVVEFSKVEGWELPDPQAIALKENGAVVEVNFDIKYASLQVNIVPEEAAINGAKWSLLNGFWNDSGDVINDLRVGDYVVEFMEIEGYAAPTVRRVNVGEGGVIETAEYRRLTGSLGVNLSPSEALSGGAKWRIKGGAWQSSDAVLPNMPVGQYTIEFLPVDGWYTPPTQDAWVADGQLTMAAGSYVRVTGSLSVTLNPVDVVTDGAMWRVAGEAWHSSGDIAYNLPTGNYTVEFSDVVGWTNPAPLSVVIGDQLSQFEAQYEAHKNSSITVNIGPNAAVYSGAQWRIYGESWQSPGNTISGLSAGLYTVEFSSIANWVAPSMQTINLGIDDSRSINVAYGVDSASTPTPVFDTPLTNSQMSTAIVVSASGSNSLSEIKAGEELLYTFDAVAGRTYLMLLQGDHAGSISIYSEDGSTLLAQSNISVGSHFGRVEWQAPTTGKFYAKVKYYDAKVSGMNNLTILVKGVKADFNNDGISDLLSRDSVTGDIAIDYLNGSSVIGGGLPVQQPGTSDVWALAGMGDFDGDGASDILWRNPDGLLSVWLMNGLELKEGGMTSVNMDGAASKSVVAVSDFDGDGRADILWQDQQNLTMTLWLMSGRQVLSASGELSMQPRFNSMWEFIGAGDFNGDHKSDILWRNMRNGHITAWFMRGREVIDGNGEEFLSSGLISVQEPLGSTWQIYSIADYSGDGLSDILWYDDENGLIRIWYMHGRSVSVSNSYWNLGYDWHLQAVGDYNGDGVNDLLARDVTDNSLYIMSLYGDTALPSTQLLEGVDGVRSTWEIYAD